MGCTCSTPTPDSGGSACERGISTWNLGSSRTGTSRDPHLVERAGSPPAVVLLVLYLAFLLGCVFVLYVVIRKAVHHGILDADDARRASDSGQQLQRTLSKGTPPDDRAS